MAGSKNVSERSKPCGLPEKKKSREESGHTQISRTYYIINQFLFAMEECRMLAKKREPKDLVFVREFVPDKERMLKALQIVLESQPEKKESALVRAEGGSNTF